MIESIYFKSNSSGTCKFSLNLHGAKHFIRIGDYMINDKSQRTQVIIYRGFTGSGKKINRISGISNVVISYDSQMLYLEIKFQFENLYSLNRAINILSGQVYPNVSPFKMDDYSLIRTDTKKFNSIVDELVEQDDTHVSAYGLFYFFKKTLYATEYNFENKKVIKCTNSAAKISSDHTQVKIKDYLPSRNSIENRIIFER